MTKNSKRIEWIDICKALGIIIVVMGHLTIPKSFDIWIHSFHMPLFFILSGLCFNEIKHSNIIKFITNRFKTLIIPYIIFSILLYYIWVLILFVFSNGTTNGSCELFKCMLNPSTLTTCYGAVNWFLPSLFLIELIFIVIGKLTKYNKKITILIMIIISLVGYFIPRLLNFNLPLAIDSSIMGLSLYGFGWLLRDIKFDRIREFFNNNKVLSYVYLLLLFAFMIPLVFLNGMTNMRTMVYGNYSLYLLNAIIISILFILFAQLVEISLNKCRITNIINMVGRNTLIILLFNPILDRLYLFITNNVSIKNPLLLLINNVFVASIVVFLCVMISIIINKHLPFLIGKKN